jgi:hypothetical protein
MHFLVEMDLRKPPRPRPLGNGVGERHPLSYTTRVLVDIVLENLAIRLTRDAMIVHRYLEHERLNWSMHSVSLMYASCMDHSCCLSTPAMRFLSKQTCREHLRVSFGPAPV